MITYSPADADVTDRVAYLMKQHHADLVDFNVRIDCLFAHPDLDEDGVPKGPPVTLNGYPCLAKVKITSPKDRAKGCGDAEIIIDFDRWEELSSATKDALLDHELQHLESTGELDDMGRPKLTSRLHDHSFGWFDVIVERHGRASIEFIQCEAFLAGTYRPFWSKWAEAVDAILQDPEQSRELTIG